MLKAPCFHFFKSARFLLTDNTNDDRAFYHWGSYEAVGPVHNLMMEEWRREDDQDKKKPDPKVAVTECRK